MKFARRLKTARTLFQEVTMKSVRYAIAGALLMTMGSATVAQQAQTARLRGTVEKLDGNVVSIKLSDGRRARSRSPTTR